MTHTIIAIDGPSASGKGSLARKLAHALGFAYLDTGALYRYVGHKVLETGGDPEDEGTALVVAKVLQAYEQPIDLKNPTLRTDEVGQAASKVAKFASVRQSLLDFQRDFATQPPPDAEGNPYPGVILDGRDIGTVICPEAPVKLFVTADTEERAKRRAKELQSKGFGVTYEAVLADMRERDARDSGRDTAPLKPASDAVILDTTTMTEGEVMEKSLSIIREKIAIR